MRDYFDLWSGNSNIWVIINSWFILIDQDS